MHLSLISCRVCVCVSVRVPLWAVLVLVGQVRSSLGGPLGPVASQVVREVTSETQAWQEEVDIWDAMQDLACRQLDQLEEVCSVTALLKLSHIPCHISMFCL